MPKSPRYQDNQKGIINYAPLLIIVAIFGIVFFLLVSSIGPFKGILNNLFPKPYSHAAVNNQLEAESGTLTGSAVLGSDTNASGGQYIQFAQSSSSPTPIAGVDPVVVAAGDVACGPASVAGSPCQQQATANTITQINPTAVLGLGDHQYEAGALVDFQNNYDKSWGAFKSITHPAIGNHEGGEGGSNAGYFNYYNGTGVQTGMAGDRSQGYYSYDIGTWHLIALNGNCGIYSFNGSATECAVGSAQEVWLKNDLATHTNQCTLAYWHQPRFSSGHEGNVTNIDTYLPFWQDLYNANVDIVLSGHSHDYERFASQTPTGAADSAKGIRQFVVGTGGRDFTGFWTNSLANSQIKNNNTFGVLKLTLHPSSYDFQFVPSTGVNGYTNGTFTDSGAGQMCH